MEYDSAGLRSHFPSARSQALLLPGAALRARAALDVYFGPPDRESEPVAQESTDSIR